MLLSFVALTIGAIIGRLRGGHHRGVLDARLRGTAFLIAAVASSLILNTMDPGAATLWLVVGFIGIVGFALANLTLTGMIVFMVGVMLNMLVFLLNGAVPVSELALESVGSVDALGKPIVDGVRESTTTATRLRFLGDVVPVPLFNKVISLGDLIAMVAAADVVTNLFLRARRRDDTPAPDSTDGEVIDLRDEPALPGMHRRHAKGGGLRLVAPSPKVRRPAHALNDLADENPGSSHMPPPPTGPSVLRPLAPPPLPQALTPPALPTAAMASTSTSTATLTLSPPPLPGADMATATATAVASLPANDEVIDLTDTRPIIDLTTSPTDEQLAEFLRRRAEADMRVAQSRHRDEAHGRNRARGRRGRQRHLTKPGR